MGNFFHHPRCSFQGRNIFSRVKISQLKAASEFDDVMRCDFTQLFATACSVKNGMCKDWKWQPTKKNIASGELFFGKGIKKKKCTCTCWETEFLSSWNEHIGWVIMDWSIGCSPFHINPSILRSMDPSSLNRPTLNEFFLFFFAMTSVERVSSMEYNKFGNTVPWVFEHFGNWAGKNQEVLPKVRQQWSLAAATEKHDWPTVFCPFVVFLFFCLWKLQKDRLGSVNQVRWHVVICFFGKADNVESSFGWVELQGQNRFEQNWQMQRKPCGLVSEWTFKFSKR